MPDNPGISIDPPGPATSSGPGHAAQPVVVNQWEEKAHLDKLTKVMFASQNIVPGSTPNKMIQVIQHAKQFPASMATALKESSRWVYAAKDVLDKNVVRFCCDSRVLEQLRKTGGVLGT
jgi:hypothetical protein